MADRTSRNTDRQRAGKAGDAPNTSAAILDAARRLFLETGYEGVNLEQVGRAAGVSRQTVYNQFGSKDAVFQAVVDRHWDTVRAETAMAFCAPLEASSDPEVVLRAFAQAMLRFVHGTNQIAFTRLVVAESRHLPWIAEAFYRAGKAPLVAAFAEALAKLAKRGLLRCEHTELAARQFMGLIQEFVIWPHVMAVEPAPSDVPSEAIVVNEAVAMFLARYGTA